MRHSTVRFVSFLLLALSIGSQPAAARDWTVVRVGVDPTSKPANYKTPEGALTGFDIDIARALCVEIGARCVFVESSWEGMIPGLRANKYDAIVSGMSITEERRKIVDFTDKYTDTPSSLLAKAGSVDGSPNSLKGKRVGVMKASIQERYAKGELAPAGAIIVSYDNTLATYIDLKSGRIDAAVSDVVDGRTNFLSLPEGKGYAFVGPLLTEERYFGVGSGIAVRKQDAELRDRLNAAIRTIRANGTWKKIADRYYDVDVWGK